MSIFVEPDPAPEGGRVTVTVDGIGPYFYRASGGGEWRELPIDPETGRATIDVPGRAPQSLDISNRDLGAGDTASVDIEGTN